MLTGVPAFDPRPLQTHQGLRRFALDFARGWTINQLFPSLRLLVRSIVGWADGVLNFMC